jgi:hypothetical protein
MNAQRLKKPSVEEWLHWAEIVVARLTDCVHAYKKLPPIDGYISEAERQQKADAAIKFLHRIHALVDRSETPTDSVADVHAHDEQIIQGLVLVFDEVIHALPILSGDMQKLLKSPWMGKYASAQAQTLFHGDDTEEHGLGSGHPEHGRMPAALVSMLEREQLADHRHPRKALLHHGEPRRHNNGHRQDGDGRRQGERA